MTNEELNPFLTRLNTLLEYYKLRQSDFCEKTGINFTTISALYTRNSSPNYKTCVMILESFEDVSAEWLMRGKGEMLLSSGVNNSNINNGDVAGNLTQSVSVNDDQNNEIAKLKLMLKGCSTLEEYKFVTELIEKMNKQ